MRRGDLTMANQLVWVDIPVLDLDRAIGFYSSVLGKPVMRRSILVSKSACSRPKEMRWAAVCVFSKIPSRALKGR